MDTETSPLLRQVSTKNSCLREKIAQLGKAKIMVLGTATLVSSALVIAYAYQRWYLSNDLANQGDHGISGYPVICPLPEEFYYDNYRYKYGSVFPFYLWFDNMSDRGFYEIINSGNFSYYSNISNSGYAFSYRTDSLEPAGFPPATSPELYAEYRCQPLRESWQLQHANTMESYYEFVSNITNCSVQFLKSVVNTLKHKEADPQRLTCEMTGPTTSCCVAALDKNLSHGDNYCPADLCLHALKGSMPVWNRTMKIYTGVVAPLTLFFLYIYILDNILL